MSNYCDVTVKMARWWANARLDECKRAEQHETDREIDRVIARRERWRKWFPWIKPLTREQAKARRTEDDVLLDGRLYRRIEAERVAKEILHLCDTSQYQHITIDAETARILRTAVTY